LRLSLLWLPSAAALLPCPSFLFCRPWGDSFSANDASTARRPSVGRDVPMKLTRDRARGESHRPTAVLSGGGSGADAAPLLAILTGQSSRPTRCQSLASDRLFGRDTMGQSVRAAGSAVSRTTVEVRFCGPSRDQADEGARRASGRYMPVRS
jgi:hypothetical protein